MVKLKVKAVAIDKDGNEQECDLFFDIVEQEGPEPLLKKNSKSAKAKTRLHVGTEHGDYLGYADVVKNEMFDPSK